MVAMFARAIQIFLVIFGILLILLIPTPTHHPSAGPAASGAYLAGSIFIKMLYIFLGLLCFLGTYKIGKRRRKQT